MFQIIPENAAVLGELICLARLTDGNPHLVSPELCRFVREALADPREELLPEIACWKTRLSPNCVHCAHPCGRFDAYDFRSPLSEPDLVQREKALLLEKLRHAADSALEDGLFLAGLAAVGVQGVDPDALHELLTRLDGISVNAE